MCESGTPLWSLSRPVSNPLSNPPLSHPYHQVCAFDTPEHLLTEMVCQRLAQEYQLVEGVDLQVILAPYLAPYIAHT